MAQDSVVDTKPVEIIVEGDVGEVTADIATPLAVVLAELLQNAVEHASPTHVYLFLSPIRVIVRDDGCGLPKYFDIEHTTSLGLLIVRDLVVSQLEGTISMGATQGGGTEVRIDLPVRGR